MKEDSIFVREFGDTGTRGGIKRGVWGGGEEGRFG